MAIISSMLSVFAVILDFISKRKLMGARINQSLFSVHVTSTERVFTNSRRNFVHRTKALSLGIAQIFELHQNTVEILPISLFSERTNMGLVTGLIVQFVVSTSEWSGKELMDKLQEDASDHLAMVIAESWNLYLPRLKLYNLKQLSLLEEDRCIRLITRAAGEGGQGCKM